MTNQLFDMGKFPLAGIHAHEQVLLWLPKGFKDYSRVLPSIDLRNLNQKQIVKLVVKSKVRKIDGTPPRVSVDVYDGKNSATLTAFGNIFSWRQFVVGDIICVEGTANVFKGRVYFTSSGIVPPRWVGKVLPRYSGARGLFSEDFVLDKTRLALSGYINGSVDFIMSHFPGIENEKTLRASSGISLPIADILTGVHEPRSLALGQAALEQAKQLASFYVVYQARLAKNRRPVPQSAIRISDDLVSKYRAMVPFSPTPHQQNALSDIISDLRSPYPAKRLVSGDVGVGKSMPLLVSAMAAREAGALTAYLVPSLLLANQMYAEAKAWFGESAPVKLISAGAKMVQSDLDGNPLLIGTTTLINRLSKLKVKPDFLITDEQHKFSRDQRESLLGPKTNMVEATATCVPRTMAFVTHGGMDVSVINQRPIEREITSKVIGSDERQRVMTHVQSVLLKGHQAAVIYPCVGNDMENQRRNVEAAFSSWDRLLPGRVAMIHGRMKDEEKAAAMKSMIDGGSDLLVASVALEVGVTIPKLKSLIVVEADRYGAASLHQMRGRLSRRGGKGWFVMIPTKDASDDSIGRLNMVASTDDGFRLAEMDMELRGYGDLSINSQDQHGSPVTLFVNSKITPKDLSEADDRIDKTESQNQVRTQKYKKRH